MQKRPVSSCSVSSNNFIWCFQSSPTKREREKERPTDTERINIGEVAQDTESKRSQRGQKLMQEEGDRCQNSMPFREKRKEKFCALNSSIKIVHLDTNSFTQASKLVQWSVQENEMKY